MSPPRPVVWSAGVSWDAIPGTDRRLATALSGLAPVLWVDPPVSPATPARLRGGAGRAPRPVLAPVTDRITRLTPVALPGLSRPGVRSTTGPLVRLQVRWALRRLGTRPAAVVAGHLDDVLGGWGDDVVTLLYGTDDFVAGAGLMGMSASWLAEREQRSLAAADRVAVVSPVLAERWRAFGADPVVLPNGADPVPAVPASAVPPEVRALPRPVVGVVGQLSERIDLDLLVAVADAGLSLLLVGPHDPRWQPGRFAALAARPNVVHTGAVPADRVPGYLAGIDVGLTPYEHSDFNRSSFPLKTLEYLSAGRPVVSTGLPAARWLRVELAETDPAGADLLRIADGPAALVAAVRSAAAVDRPERARAFAERHSWERRAERLAAELRLVAP